MAAAEHGGDTPEGEFLNSTLPAFRRQLEVSEASAKCLSTIVRFMQYLLKNIFTDELPYPEFEVLQLVGSVSDGILPPRGVKGTENSDYDVDIMYILAVFNEEAFSKFVEPVGDGTYRLDEVKKQTTSDPQAMMMTQTASLCIKAYLSNVAPENHAFASSEGVSMTNFCMFNENSSRFVDPNRPPGPTVPGMPTRPLDMPKFDVSNVIHGPAISEKAIQDRPELVPAFPRYKQTESDTVCAYQMNFWPPDAQEWRHRKRHWPPEQVVEEAIKQGCQLVYKPKKNQKSDGHSADILEGDKVGDWRLTFTLAEKVVNQARSSQQKLLHLMAKTVFYAHLHLEEDGDEISSYMVKTCMMWLQEETSVDAWKDENMLDLLKDLLGRLRAAVSEGSLSHYFSSQINIIKDYSPSLLDKARCKLDQVIADLPRFICTDVLADVIKSGTGEEVRESLAFLQNIPKKLDIPDKILD